MPDFQTRLPGMISLLKRLVESESPSHDKAAVDRLGALVKEECLRLGGDVKIHPQAGVGDLIEAKFEAGRHPFLHPPYGDTSPLGEMGVLLLSHMDTVFPWERWQKCLFMSRLARSTDPERWI